ncbi:MAG: cobT [Frankiales bacterium]|nr:cobT [Frankiales bacterium]
MTEVPDASGPDDANVPSRDAASSDEAAPDAVSAVSQRPADVAPGGDEAAGATEPAEDPWLRAVHGIEYPDFDIGYAAQQRQAQLTKPAGSLGRLEELSVWVATVQGQCPPHDFERPRVVVFAGDHGIASAGVSAYPPEVTAQMVANFVAGGAAVNVLARSVGASVRVVDMAVDAETDPSVSEFKVRRGSGRIDIEDALTIDEANRAIAAGMTIADQEIDAGADLLIAGDMGIGNTTPAAVLIALLTDVEPVKVIGRGTGIDDSAWIRKCAAVRDARRRGFDSTNDPAELLAKVGGADFAAITGFLVQAAYRRTPVLLDGVVVTAAAMVAHRANTRVVRWMTAGHLSVEPAHHYALERLGLKPLLELDMRLGEGSGALVALPLLRAAVSTLAEMATFSEASVSERDSGPAISQFNIDDIA